MEPQEKTVLQSKLAREVRSYMRVRGQGDESETRQLHSVCSVLARLLGRLLETSESEKWDRYHWVDDVLPSLAAVVSDEELTILGFMIWGQRRQTQQWVEPFFASVRAPESGEELLGYHIMCGDAALGLGKSAYGTHVRSAGRSDPEDWMFVFSQGKI